MDVRHQLEEIFVKIWDSQEVDKEMEEVFPHVRLAVFGRSGVGKTTLISLMIGQDAPAGLQNKIAHGTAGKQDINDEWIYPDPKLPLLIHDSNGMDVKGPERVDTIRKFLDVHQNSNDMSERIHLVWYVISAIDRRFLDDGDVLNLVCSYNIPFVLIVTNNDVIIPKDKQIVTEELLDKLLVDVPDMASVKKNMVRVGNDVREKNGQLILDGVDKAALQQLHETTKKLIDKKLRYVWAAAQALDMMEKLEASAAIIVRYANAAFLASFASPIPLVEETTFAFMFAAILRSFYTIWRVPQTLRTVLYEDIARPEGNKSIFGHLFKSTMTATGLLITIGTTVITSGMAFPIILAWLGTAGLLNSKSSTAILLTYSSVILGCILYVKAHQKSSKLWDDGETVERYKKLCTEFAESKIQNELPKRVGQCHSRWDTLFRKKNQKGKIKNAMLDVYKDILGMRPNSLRSMMDSENIAQETTDACYGDQNFDGNSNPDCDQNSDYCYDRPDTTRIVDLVCSLRRGSM